MWKCASRRFRDTIERANHFDKRTATGVWNDNDGSDGHNQSNVSCRWFSTRKTWACHNNRRHLKSGQDSGYSICIPNKQSIQNTANENKKTKACKESRDWFATWKCMKCLHGGNNTNGWKWNFDNLTNSWISVITWSGAFILGWYASQLIHLKNKYHSRRQRVCPSISHILTSVHAYVNSVNDHSLFKNETSNLDGSFGQYPFPPCVVNILSSLKPYASYVNKDAVSQNTNANIDKLVAKFMPSVHSVSNENNDVNYDTSHDSDTSRSPTSSESFLDNDLGSVLNSIENKLGLSAIENGQVKDGINMLRSAAQRYHAPALYNLGLCYEQGIGVDPNEKMAVEYYSSAAALQHPGALYNLGIYYGQGRGGLSRDSTTALRLLRLAAVQGQEEAVAALKSLNADTPKLPENDEINSWSMPYTQTENMVPASSTLFVTNINYAPFEGTVF